MASQDDSKREDHKEPANTGKVICCLHCGNQTFVHLVASHRRHYNDENSLIWGDDTWNLYLCPVCYDVTLEHISVFSEDLDEDYDLDGNPFIKPRTAILYPVNPSNSLPEPHKDLPEELVKDYEEARLIAHYSPRGAAALLRLLLQKLCKVIGGKGQKIDDDIKFLVGKGLPKKAQQAFDIVRVVGNNAVHPGQLDLADNIQTVKSLFHLVNIIIEEVITRPRMIDDLYKELPASNLVAIKKRDKVDEQK